MKDIYVISQIYLPFFRQIIKHEKDKKFLILTTTIIDYLIARLIKNSSKANIRIKKLSSNKKRIYNLTLENFGNQKVFDSNISKILKFNKSTIALQWNGNEHIDTEIRKFCNKSIIIENGYFRPNSLTIDSEFIRNAPRGLRDSYITNNLLDNFDKKNIELAYKMFNKLNILDILYRIIRPRKGIRPRKSYYRSASLSNILGKIQILKKNKKSLVNNLENSLIYYGQVADDSSFILDPNYINLKSKISKLINYTARKGIQFYYRPHPKEFFDPLKKWFISQGIKIDNSKEFLSLRTAKYHATFSSTVGFELLTKNIPIIVLGDPFYRNAPGAFHIDEIDENLEINQPSPEKLLNFINRCKKNHIIF